MQSLSNQPCENSVSSNKESILSSNPNPGTVEIPPVSAMANMVCSATTTITTMSSLQPACNTARTSGPLESQYSQQQSQIFVFSTSLANKAAEAVITGQYPSVIAYHCSQPGTKYFLEKHPLRMQQFHRQNSNSWCGNASQTNKGSKQMKPGTPNQLPGNAATSAQFHCLGPSACCGGPCNMHGNRICNGTVPHRGCVNYSSSSPHIPHGPGGLNIRGMSDVNNTPFWPQQHYQQNMMMGPCNRFQNPAGGHGRCMDMAGSNQHMGGNMMGSMAANPNQQQFSGVKVPDESLTPQQRQHREEQLAMIRKMHQLLFPDQHRPETYMKSGNVPNMPNIMRTSVDDCSRPRLDMFPHESCVNMAEHHPAHPDACFSCTSPGMPRQCAHAPQSTFQMEWQKMQQYSEDKTKKQTLANGNTIPPCQVAPMLPPSQNQLNAKVPSPCVNGNNPTSQAQPFSAPYSQAPHILPNSHPPSPCSGSLVNSPSSAGVVNSPADASRQFNHPTPPCSRVPHPSPGPASSNSLHATPLNSPTLQTSLTSVPTPGSTPSTPTNQALHSPNPSSTLATSSNSQTVSPSTQTQTEIPVSGAPGEGEVMSSIAGAVTGDSPFRENIQKCNQKQPSENTVNPQNSNKEPSLMPVPSPQQIHYMNTFDGQELTIQKQPNTTMSEQDGANPRVQSNERTLPPSSQFVCSNMSSPHQGPSMPQVSCSDKAGAEGDVSEQVAPIQRSLEGGPQRPPLVTNQAIRFSHNQQFQGSPQNIQRYTTPNMGCDGMHHMNNSNMMQINGMEGHGRYCGHVPQASASPVMTAPVEMMRCVRPRMSMEPAQRFRGPSPHLAGIEMMQTRYSSVSPHLMGNENVPSPYGTMTSDVDPAHHQYCNSGNNLMSLSRNGMVDTPDSGVMGSTHLQNLQKMAPPFDSPSSNKIPVERTLATCTGGEGPPVMPAVPGSAQATATQGTMSRLSHFDPAASVPAISDSGIYQPLGSTGITPEGHQNMVNGTMNMTSMHMATNSPVGRVNFQANSQTMHGVQEVNGPVNMPCHQFTGNGQMMQDVVGGPQTVNNTYVNATMSIQQLNIQNASTSTYSANGSLLGMNNQAGMVNPQNIPGPVAAHTVSSSATSSHPIVHSAISPKLTPTMSPQLIRGANVQQQAYFNQQFGTQRPGAGVSPGMVPRTPGVASMNGPNIQVKVNAPNTIQYMPVRQQNMLMMQARAPGVEMMQQRFSPDGKFMPQGPQYYGPSGQIPPSNMVVGIMGQDQGMNSQRCPAPNGGMGQIYSSPGEISPYMRPPMPNEIGNTMNNFGTGHGTNFLIPGKQMLGSSAVLVGPEASQPLPPTVGQSLNYKQSAFYGLTPADPNYAVQFHNFQQQLYATNTRGQVNSQNSGSSGQGFFGTK